MQFNLSTFEKLRDEFFQRSLLMNEQTEVSIFRKRKKYSLDAIINNFIIILQGDESDSDGSNMSESEFENMYFPAFSVNISSLYITLSWTR